MTRFTNLSLDAETRGMAFIGHSLPIAILKCLTTKKLLTDQDAYEILDSLLIGVEEMKTNDPTDESLEAARVILDGMIHIFRDSESKRK